jgi:hypothetical protein
MKVLRAIVAASLIGGLTQAHAQSDIAGAGKALAAERNELRECWNAAAQLYATKTCEPAESIIVAAFGKCMLVEGRYRKALIAKAALSENGAREFISGYRAGGREHMASVILDARSATGRCPLNSN